MKKWLSVFVLFALVGCESEETSWQQAQSADTPEQYQTFVEAYPGSKHIDVARQRWDDVAWQQANAVASISAYRHYLEQDHVRSRADQAEQQLESLVPQEEDALVATLQAEGPGERFQVPGMKPSFYLDQTMKFTMRAVQGGYVLNSMEFPGDQMMGGISYSPTVNRFDGAVDLNGHTFTSTGDLYERLTFAMLDDGYVYLRGQGTVTLDSGEHIVFDGIKLRGKR